jgi:hypothetical protein
MLLAAGCHEASATPDTSTGLIRFMSSSNLIAVAMP